MLFLIRLAFVGTGSVALLSERPTMWPIVAYGLVAFLICEIAGHA